MQIPRSIRRLVASVLDGPGDVPAELRRAAFDADSPALPAALRPYLAKTSHHAYRITDRDIDALRAAGYDDDQIFELTICSAVGAGFTRLERALRALEEA